MKKLSRTIISLFLSAVAIAGAFTSAVYAGSAAQSPAKYRDVKETDWYAESVGKLSVLDIVNGLNDGRFDHQGEVTRAQFVKMLVQAMGYKKIDSVSFVDMRANSNVKPHWAAVYVETALRNGVIIKAEEGDRFYPDVPITREDMVMMMCRALNFEPSDGANPYFDLGKANGYFTKAYEEYLVRGIPIGDKVAFNASGVTTRAQAAVIISRLVDYKADAEGFAAKMAMEERFSNGTVTKADIELKRELEMAKAEADPNYIMEPIITVERDEYYKDREWFKLYFENKTDYSDDCKWKLEVTNYQQLNTFEVPKPDGTFKKFNITNWRDLGSLNDESERASSYRLGRNYYTTQALIKSFKLSVGMEIKFKITVKNDIREKVVYKTVILQ